MVARVPIAALFMGRYAKDAVDIGSGVGSSDRELRLSNDHSQLRDDLEAKPSQNVEAA